MSSAETTSATASLPFWKMHGAGNDFVVASPPDPEADWSALATSICDRHFGVGADGLILVLPSSVADRRMRMFNPDGSEAEMCGNGIRCLVKYVFDTGLRAHDSPTMHVETQAGVLQIDALFDSAGLVDRVRVSMGTPSLTPASVGVQLEQAPPVLALPISAAGRQLEVALVSMGNPHAVSFLDDTPDAYPVTEVGPAVEHHSLFAHRTNVEFAHVRDRGNIDLRVWERGVGETLACGSGASATAVAARLRGLVDDSVEVTLPGGVLHIEWDGDGDVWMTGPAVKVFESQWPFGPSD